MLALDVGRLSPLAPTEDDTHLEAVVGFLLSFMELFALRFPIEKKKYPAKKKMELKVTPCPSSVMAAVSSGGGSGWGSRWPDGCVAAGSDRLEPGTSARHLALARRRRGNGREKWHQWGGWGNY